MGFWINVYEDIIDHPKTRKLMKLSGLSDDEVVGKLIKLWTWGIKNADSTGLIVCADNLDIADVIASKPYSFNRVEPIKVVECMIESGWIEAKGSALFLHDWDEWQGHYYRSEEKRKRDTERKRRYREAQREIGVSNVPGLSQSTTTPSMELPAAPGQTKSVQEEPLRQSDHKPSPADPKKPAKPAAPKVKYGEFVSMTDNEYKSLIEEVGEPAAKMAVDILDNYKGSSGKKYKSDYRAIRMWVVDKIRERNPNLIKPKEEVPKGVHQNSSYLEEWSGIKRGEG